MGTATADEVGRFDAPLTLPNLDVGRYHVVAKCGVTLDATLDVVRAGANVPATSALAVLIFFILVSGMLLRRRRFR